MEVWVRNSDSAIQYNIIEHLSEWIVNGGSHISQLLSGSLLSEKGKEARIIHVLYKGL
jgi:hypothetical protein